MSCLAEYHWPGNVRELKNVIERCVVRARSRHITPDALPSEVRFRAGAPVKPNEPQRPSMADGVFERLVNGHESFWSAAYAPFMSRDLTREDLRRIVTLGLERTAGSYRLLLHLFNMKPEDYKRFLNFLGKYQCRLPFQPFRVLSKAEPREDARDGGESTPAFASPRARTAG